MKEDGAPGLKTGRYKPKLPLSIFLKPTDKDVLAGLRVDVDEFERKRSKRIKQIQQGRIV